MERALGLQITWQGHSIRLKWHRLRRSLADPEFGLATMAAGLRIGATMELDLQLRGDGGFVVLHDETLDRETSGSGAVRAHDAAGLAALRYRHQDCPLIVSEDLAGLLGTAHPQAMLQFDMQNTAEEVGQRGIEHLVGHFADRCGNLIVSGGSAALIRAVAEAMPGIGRGYDPTDQLMALWPDLTAMERHLRLVLRDAVKPDMVYLQWQMLVRAARRGLDMVAMAHADGVRIDAWTHHMAASARGFTPAEWAEFTALLDLHPDQITTDEAVATEAAVAARTMG